MNNDAGGLEEESGFLVRLPAAAVPQRLITAAAQFDIALSERDAARLIRLLDELDDWNQRMNLTAIRERSQQITKHLLDSLSIQPFLRGSRVCDVGTGAGFPGIPLAIVNAGHQFTLIDSTAKKLKFIDHVAQLLELSNIETVHTRAENYRLRAALRCRRIARGRPGGAVRQLGRTPRVSVAGDCWP